MNNQLNGYRVCTRGIWDTTVPGISFDEHGVSNYAKMFDNLCETYPRGEIGKLYWENIVDKIKEKVTKDYPKHLMVSSHIGRRSFASNNYGKIPTSFLMYITGHTTEAMFLTYIGKSNKDIAMELTNYF